MSALPEEIEQILIDFHAASNLDVDQLHHDLAGAGWRLVPESVIPRAPVLDEAARLMRNAATVNRPPTGLLPVHFEDAAARLDYLRELSAAVLGVDLGALDGLVGESG